MNLYTIDVVHYAPKDQHRAIEEYVIAESDQKVFDYLYSKYWSDNEWEQWEKDLVLDVNGEWEFEVYDLHYGATQRGWTLVSENLAQRHENALIALNIAKVVE